MEPQKDPNPNYLPYPPQSTDDEIDLRELFKALWKGKWLIIATTFVFALGSALYALSLPNIYKADALLAPAKSSNGGGLSQMAGQLGGLAAFAGVNLGGNEALQTELAVQVMKSRQFVEAFINKHDLLVPLMAAKDWDLSSNKLILDEKVYDLDNGEWLREAKDLRGRAPTAQEAFERFTQEVFSFEKDKESSLYIISVNYYSPYIAQQWVNWLVEDINKVMRERAIAEASQNLAYLNTQLQKTAVSKMQMTFYNLIEEQTKSLMLAEVQDEFVFKVVDPAVVPEIKSTPNRLILVLVPGILGGIIVTIILSVIHLLRKTNRNESK
ncbi:TPA: Wzz/FepE/Etk N-terminal domain-containing protein [Vibrio parahaemolyticus]|nr:LPS O-antigen length regulator [Vibrio parahaemolyticus]EJG1663001.1 LPS O-antigen length regulator [Vibrio parahaemolyticus]EJG1680395.1 LPS O-antigen length regulator [Vibrio parahaemolyticus]EJG1770536.1 LPS O-antigen length regulator [Vibrio parahaemolyticus]EJG1795022.1 LPS O-antigen length regulator [Vibrio parahaemolyticus]